MYRYLIAVMLTFIVLLSMFGCGKKQEETTDTTTVPAVVTQPAEVTETEPVGGIVDSPFYDDGDLDENGEVVGAEDSVIATVPQETKPTETKEPENVTGEPDDITPTSATEPAETTAPTVPQETKPVVIPGATQELTEYEKYNAMSGEEQMAFMQSMGIEKFFAWYDKAKAEYEAAHPEIEIGDGVIDAGQLVG